MALGMPSQQRSETGLSCILAFNNQPQVVAVADIDLAVPCVESGRLGGLGYRRASVLPDLCARKLFVICQLATMGFLSLEGRETSKS